MNIIKIKIKTEFWNINHILYKMLLKFQNSVLILIFVYIYMRSCIFVLFFSILPLSTIFIHIMARTSHMLARWWNLLCNRATCLVGYLWSYLTEKKNNPQIDMMFHYPTIFVITHMSILYLFTCSRSVLAHAVLFCWVERGNYYPTDAIQQIFV